MVSVVGLEPTFSDPITDKGLEDLTVYTPRGHMAYKNKADLYKNQIQRWINIKRRAIAYKGGVCTICKIAYPYPAMQFHHRDVSTKDVSWTKLRLRSWHKITAELEKCDLVCANCHSIIHSNYILSS